MTRARPAIAAFRPAAFWPATFWPAILAIGVAFGGFSFASAQQSTPQASAPASGSGEETAFAPETFAPDTREALRAEIRAYLLEHPELLMEAIGVLEQREAAAQAEGDVQLVADNREALLDDGHSWVGGNPEGDVTIVEFLDYRCGYCRQAFPEVAELIESDGNIRLIVKEFPILGEESLLASRFAIATRAVAGDAAYHAVHDALMTSRAEVNEDTLRALAAENKLQAEPILAAMSDPGVDRIIAENRALGQRLKINGTPSFVFGDRMVRGYVPLDAMQEIVAAAREG